MLALPWDPALCAPAAAAVPELTPQAQWTDMLTLTYLSKENRFLQGLAFVLQPTCQTYLSSGDHGDPAG